MDIKKIRQSFYLLFLSLSISLSALSVFAAPQVTDSRQDIARLGLPPSDVTAYAPARISLGKMLFFERRLSADGSISCAECHVPERAFADGKTVATGIHGLAGNRNTPSLFNVAYQRSLFWDGRSTSLETQVTGPLLNPREHGMKDEAQILDVLKSDPNYRRLFAAAFGDNAGAVSFKEVEESLASYERTLLAGGSPFDRYLYGKNKNAMSASAIRGLDLFRGRARCSACHQIGKRDALLTDQDFHVAPAGLPKSADERLGVIAQKVARLKAAGDQDTLDRLVSSDSDVASLGRFLVTLQPSDIGKFKTPSLRNVALTAPYMHDGSVATLPEVIEIELYTRNRDMRDPIILTSTEKEDLLAFLNALTSPVAANGASSPQ